MATPIGQLVVELSLDSSKFNQGITKAKRNLKTYEQDTRSSMNLAKQNNFTLGDTNRALSNLVTTYQAYDETLRSGNQQLADWRAEGKEGTVEYENLELQMAGVRRKMIDTNKVYKDFRLESWKANSSTYKFGAGMEKLGVGMESTGRRVSEVGKFISQAGAIATAGGALFVKQAMDYEEGLKGIQRVSGASNGEMKQLSTTLRGLATSMNVTHDETLQIAESASRLGIAQKDIGEFTRVMAMMGATTDMSVDQASNSIARFTSITGSGVEGAERLGSTLVYLGSEFATTESEIMQSAMLMVGTLSSLGATEPEILGIATAMGALGISAERGGGSISKFFSELEVAAIEGGEAIEGFAQVAGMEIEEFSRKVQNEPVEAFQAFIDGLARIQEEGGSVIDVLDELGISETRMRDTIMRLAGGHETLAEALRKSNDEYGKGTALQEQYATMMESTSAQWQLVKNQLKDVAIDMGSSLLPAVQSVIESSDPLIQKVKGMADGFSNLSPKIQENIVKWGALSVGIGAGTNAIGRTISSTGSILKLFGGIVRGTAGGILHMKNEALGGLPEAIGAMGSSTSGASQAVEALGTGASGTASAMEALGMGASLTAGGVKTVSEGAKVSSSAIGQMGLATAKSISTFQALKVIGSTLFSPTGVMVMGITAGAVALGAYALKARKAKREAQAIEQAKTDWGLLSPDQAQIAQVEEFARAYTDFRTQLEVAPNLASMDSINEALSEMNDNINQLSAEKIGEIEENIAGQSSEVSDILLEGQLGRIDFLENVTDRANEADARIRELNQTAKEESRSLTQAELREVERLNQEISHSYANLRAKNSEEAQNLFDAFNADVTKMNSVMLDERRESLRELADMERGNHEANMNELTRQLMDKEITEGQFRERQEELEQIHHDQMRDIQAAHAQTMAEQSIKSWAEYFEMTEDEIRASSEDFDAILRDVADAMEEEFGRAFSLEEVREMLEMEFGEMFTFLEGQIDTIANVFDDPKLREGAQVWNNLLEELNAEFQDYGETWQEQLFAMSEASDLTNDHWNSLVFAKKNAPLDSNARETVSEVMLFHKNWDDMTFDDIIALIDVPQQGIDQMNEALAIIGTDWNNMQIRVLELMLAGQQPGEAVINAMADIKPWDEWEPEDKQLVLSALLSNQGLEQGLKDQDVWNKAEFVEHALDIIYNGEDVEAKLDALVKEWADVGDLPDVELGVDAPEAGTVQEAIQGLIDIGEQANAMKIAIEMTDNGEETKGNITAVQEVLKNFKTESANLPEMTFKSNAPAEQEKIDDLTDSMSDAQETAGEGANFEMETNATETKSNVDDTTTAIKDNQTTASEGAHFEMTDNSDVAIANATAIKNSIESIPRERNVTVNVKEVRLAKGTPYHQGGPAILGDGGRREPFLTPAGYFGVSPNKDTPYVLPRGTQVWPSISKFKADSSRSARLREYLNQLPHYAQGTSKSFLDSLRTIEVPKISTGSGAPEQVGDIYHITLDLNVVGSSLTRDQADNIIEPLIESAERLGRRKGARVNLGNM